MGSPKPSRFPRQNPIDPGVQHFGLSNNIRRQIPAYYVAYASITRGVAEISDIPVWVWAEYVGVEQVVYTVAVE
jgi:hypothetical protein